jgi:hypothetical protein
VRAHTDRHQVQALALALPQLPQLRALLLRNNGIDDAALQLLAAALMQPSCAHIVCLDLSRNVLSASAPLLLQPLLHQPPQAQLQARRRWTADAAVAVAAASTAAAGDGWTRRSGGGSSSSAVTAGGISLAGSSSCSSSSCRAGAAGSAGQWAGSTCTAAGFDRAMLQQLVLSGNERVGDKGARVLCRLVGSGDCLLRLLDLSGCGVTEALWASLQGLLEGAK